MEGIIDALKQLKPLCRGWSRRESKKQLTRLMWPSVREIDVIRRMFMFRCMRLGVSKYDIARMTGVSHPRIIQVTAKAKTKLYSDLCYPMGKPIDRAKVLPVLDAIGVGRGVAVFDLWESSEAFRAQMLRLVGVSL